MKKIIAMLLVVTMIAVLLAGCGEGKKMLKILDTDYVLEDYAICVAKENTELLDNINAALAELEADGTRDAIVGKYINGTAHDLTFQADVAADAPVLTMATNAAFPPYEFIEGSDIIGIDAEIAANGINIASLANGIYTVVVSSESANDTFRLIVKK